MPCGVVNLLSWWFFVLPPFSGILEMIDNHFLAEYTPDHDISSQGYDEKQSATNHPYCCT